MVWNIGHLHQLAVDGTVVAAAGLDNQRSNGVSEYGGAIVVLDLADLPERPDEPIVMRVDEELQAPARYVVRLPTDSLDGDPPLSVNVEGGVVSVETRLRLIYALDLESGVVTAEPTAAWLREYGERRLLDPELPADPQTHIAALLADVIVNTPN